MSNLITPVDHQILEAVTGGTTTTPRCSSSSNDALLQTLTSLSSTLNNLGSNNNNNGGLTMTEVMMFGLLMSQNRQVNVFVRRPFW